MPKKITLAYKKQETAREYLRRILRTPKKDVRALNAMGGK